MSVRTILVALCLGLALAANAPARGEDAACAPPPAAGRPGDYRAIFQSCRNDASSSRIALRRMSLGDVAALLLVDPESLATSVERASCWRCEDTFDEAQKDTRFLRALKPPAVPAQQAVLTNAGLIHGAGSGVFVTGDLCPSKKPLDRAFLQRFAGESQKTPVALAVSGLWIVHHRADLEWLKGMATKGALDISWVNHSYRHPYARGRRDAATYLLTPGTDIEREIFETERLLISLGVVPSVFFRFPGLVADARLLDEVRSRHLIPLGADSWLVLGPPPRQGSIVLVHPNGNEPVGLKLFERALEKGKMPRPFRRIEEAP